jgi:hypothetical protein
MLVVDPDGIADSCGYAAICVVSGTLGEKCPVPASRLKTRGLLLPPPPLAPEPDVRRQARGSVSP